MRWFVVSARSGGADVHDPPRTPAGDVDPELAIELCNWLITVAQRLGYEPPTVAEINNEHGHGFGDEVLALVIEFGRGLYATASRSIASTARETSSSL